MNLLESPASAVVKHKPSGLGEKAGSESESLSSGNKSGDNSPQASPYSAKKLESLSAQHQSSTSIQSGECAARPDRLPNTNLLCHNQRTAPKSLS